MLPLATTLRRAVLLFCVLLAMPALAQKPTFTVGWSIYAGWTPYHYMQKSGLLKKWADKYGIVIKVQRFDYAPSLDAFVGRNIDACTMTNMEALDMPAASGVPTTVILIGDYSNGNDALLVRGGLQMKDLVGRKMLLVEKTVSDLQAAFLSDASVSAVVTWKPMLSQLAQQKAVTSLFSSSQIPGEILDLTVVRTEVLDRADGSGKKFAQALAGAWYEMMSLMSAQGGAADK